MSILTLSIYFAGVVGALTILIGLLPDAGDYPYPEEISETLYTIVAMAHNFNTILPIQEFLLMLKTAMVIVFITRFIWPSAMYIFKALTRT